MAQRYQIVTAKQGIALALSRLEGGIQLHAVSGVNRLEFRTRETYEMRQAVQIIRELVKLDWRFKRLEVQVAKDF